MVSFTDHVRRPRRRPCATSSAGRRWTGCRPDTETLNESIKEIVDVTTKKWGVPVDLVELKDIQLPDSMQRGMAREAEAEWGKRGKIIAAEGATLSADKLAGVADVIAAHPIAVHLRSLPVLSAIATEHHSTIVFPAQLLKTAKAVNALVQLEANGIRPEARPS